MKVYVVNNPQNPSGRIYIYRSAEIGYQQKLAELHARNVLSSISDQANSTIQVRMLATAGSIHDKIITGETEDIKGTFYVGSEIIPGTNQFKAVIKFADSKQTIPIYVSSEQYSSTDEEDESAKDKADEAAVAIWQKLGQKRVADWRSAKQAEQRVIHCGYKIIKTEENERFLPVISYDSEGGERLFFCGNEAYDLPQKATEQARALGQSMIKLQKISLTPIKPDDSIHLDAEKPFKYFAQYNNDKHLMNLKANLNTLKEEKRTTPMERHEEHAYLDQHIPRVESLIQQRITQISQPFLDDIELRAAIKIDKILKENSGYTFSQTVPFFDGEQFKEDSTLVFRELVNLVNMEDYAFLCAIQKVDNVELTEFKRFVTNPKAPHSFANAVLNWYHQARFTKKDYLEAIKWGLENQDPTAIPRSAVWTLFDEADNAQELILETQVALSRRRRPILVNPFYAEIASDLLADFAKAPSVQSILALPKSDSTKGFPTLDELLQRNGVTVNEEQRVVLAQQLADQFREISNLVKEINECHNAAELPYRDEAIEDLITLLEAFTVKDSSGNCYSLNFLKDTQNSNKLEIWVRRNKWKYNHVKQNVNRLSELLNEQAQADSREVQVKKFDGLDRMLYKITLLAITKGIERYRTQLHILPQPKSAQFKCEKLTLSGPNPMPAQVRTMHLPEPREASQPTRRLNNFIELMPIQSLGTPAPITVAKNQRTRPLPGRFFRQQPEQNEKTGNTQQHTAKKEPPTNTP